MRDADLRSELNLKGFELSPDQLQGLKIYLQLLVKWNRAVNLVGYSHWHDILHNLVLDSFHLERFLSRTVPMEAPRSLDLGAGAGLPGIPLRLVWKKGAYYLVEIRSKRAVFMRQAVQAMGLADTYVINRKARELGPDLLPADLIISRAFMPLDGLLPLAGSMLRPQGQLIIMANEDIGGRRIDGFRLLREEAYPAGGRTRWFWALEKGQLSKTYSR